MAAIRSYAKALSKHFIFQGRDLWMASRTRTTVQDLISSLIPFKAWKMDQRQLTKKSKRNAEWKRMKMKIPIFIISISILKIGKVIIDRTNSGQIFPSAKAQRSGLDRINEVRLVLFSTYFQSRNHGGWWSRWTRARSKRGSIFSSQGPGANGLWYSVPLGFKGLRFKITNRF